MKPRFPTPDSVFSALAEDKSWRTRELAGLLQAFDKQPDNAKYIGRAFIAMLYAHWEGFVKRASTIYLTYLHDRKIPPASLTDCLLGVHLKQRNPELLHTQKLTGYIEAVSYIRCPTGVAEFNIDMAHFTSNLKSDILREITGMLGLSYAEFEKHETFIDKDLVDLRHKVAHGARIERSLDKEIIRKWHEKIMILIDIFKTQIENAIVLESYLVK